MKIVAIECSSFRVFKSFHRLIPVTCSVHCMRVRKKVPCLCMPMLRCTSDSSCSLLTSRLDKDFGHLPPISDVRRKNCLENFIFFRKISENFIRIFPENFQYFSIIRMLLYENFKCISNSP